MPQRSVRLLIAITILCVGGITGCEPDRVTPPSTPPCAPELAYPSAEVLPRNQLHIQIGDRDVTLDPPLQVVETRPGGRVLRAEVELLKDRRWQKVKLDAFRDLAGLAVGVTPKELVLTGNAPKGNLRFTDPLKPEDPPRLVKYNLTLYTEADDTDPDQIIDPVLIEKP